MRAVLLMLAAASAGAHDVGMLMASPVARGLFHKAIGESGSVVIRAALVSSEQVSKTVAAICVFAFGARHAILDGNVKRLFARRFGIAGFPGDAKVAAKLWRQAERELPRGNIESYTQGLMDLGATLCSPRRPQCSACPLQRQCVARREGDPERYPLKSRVLKRTKRRNALLWLVDGERVWLVQRPHRGVWAGLWTPPLYDALEELRVLADRWPGSGEALVPIDHALTHLDWHLQPWRHRLPGRLAAARRAALEAELPRGRWFTLEQALALGLPAPVRKLIS